MNEGKQINGAALTADFQNVLISMATMQVADREAQVSENSTIDYLKSVDKGMLNPGDIPLGSQSQLARASLDAHIKKAQASQIKAMGEAQIKQLLAQDKIDYRGKKVKVRVIQKQEKPIESLWFDPQKGYRRGVMSTSGVSGRIEEVMLDKNALMIKPGYLGRLINPGRKFFIIYVINPESLEPMVELEIS